MTNEPYAICVVPSCPLVAIHRKNLINFRHKIMKTLQWYSAYQQIVTVKFQKNYFEEFSSLVVFLVDMFRKFPKKLRNVTIWW